MPPPGATGIRVDSGVNIGGKIDVYYDSMLAKLICHGKTREDARRGLIEALNGYHIEGVSTNIDFVTSVLCLPEFAEGNLSTGFIEQHFEGGVSKRSPSSIICNWRPWRQRSDLPHPYGGGA